MPIYQTAGQLTGTIEPSHRAAAQAYLATIDMTQFLEGDLKAAVELVRWELDRDGHGYRVTATCRRELTADELTRLSRWVSGQNSDGLGEGFEQQSFAEQGYDEDDYEMISFDWQTNYSTFTKLAVDPDVLRRLYDQVLQLQVTRDRAQAQLNNAVRELGAAELQARSVMTRDAISAILSPREHAVPCSICLKPTLNPNAICNNHTEEN